MMKSKTLIIGWWIQYIKENKNPPIDPRLEVEGTTFLMIGQEGNQRNKKKMEYDPKAKLED
jgi:hypothetical protein